MNDINQSPEYTKIAQCRLCDARVKTKIVVFPDVPLGNNLLATEKHARAAKSYPLELLRCMECGHFQLGHSVNSNLLYATNYTYLTGVSSHFKDHFEHYVSWIFQNTQITPGELVVHIGSNDGTCLKAFQKKGLLVCGVDPASEPARIANKQDVFTVNDFFSKHSKEVIEKKFGKPTLVTSHNVLAHVDDLKLTFELIFDMLAPGGAFCFEIGYFGSVYKNNLFDTIYHEHLDYHHASPLVSVLSDIGFYVSDVETNNIQGGSLRILCFKSTTAGFSQNVTEFLEREKTVLLPPPWTAKGWGDEIRNIMGRFGETVRNYVRNNKYVAAYGAPTKATLLLAMSGLDETHIMYVVEDNELKIDKFLPSSSIAIVSPENFSNEPPDVILILAWNFFDEILNRLSELIKHRCIVITPLPKFKEVILNDKF